MNGVRRWSVVIAVVVVGVLALVAFFVGGRSEESASTSTTTTTTTTTTTITTIATTTTAVTTTTAEPDPGSVGLPDPESLVGLETYSVQVAPGVWRAVIDGRVTELSGGGRCFQGPGAEGDICGYALGVLYAGDTSGAPPSDSALLLLEQFRSRRADGTAVWMIIDAVITRTADGEPGWLEFCDEEEAVAFYESGTIGGKFVVTAAWGANSDATALNTIDPSSIACYYSGD